MSFVRSSSNNNTVEPLLTDPPRSRPPLYIMDIIPGPDRSPIEISTLKTSE